MLFKLTSRYRFVVPALYVLGIVILFAALGYVFFRQAYCEDCDFSQINPSSYLMPIIAYLSIGLVGITIAFARKTASEKNALEFVSDMEDQRENLQQVYQIRKSMLLPSGKLDRRKASVYMEGLYQIQLPVTRAPECDVAALPNGNSPEEASSAHEKDIKFRVSASAVLNAMEKCANAIRYGIYDEDFIYNIYGSQFIDLYELTYGLIKERQLKNARIWVNFEWLAVKWTLRRNITGVISKESNGTSYVINEALSALKEHNKIRPIKRRLKKYERKLERRKFPM